MQVRCAHSAGMLEIIREGKFSERRFSAWLLQEERRDFGNSHMVLRPVYDLISRSTLSALQTPRRA